MFKAGNIVARKIKHAVLTSNFPALYGADMAVMSVREHDGKQYLIFNDGFEQGWEASNYHLVWEKLSEQEEIEQWVADLSNADGCVCADNLLQHLLEHPENVANMLLSYAEQMEE